MLKIKLIVLTKKTKDNKPFKVYKVVSKDGKLTDCRFTQTCCNIPTLTSFIYVNEKDINLDSKRLYPCYWIKNIEKVEEIEQKSNLEDFFEKVEK